MPSYHQMKKNEVKDESPLYIRNVRVGTIIELCTHPGAPTIEAEIIGWYISGERCVAWNSEALYGKHVSGLDYANPSYHITQSYKRYKYFQWVAAETIVSIVPAIISPNQVCIGCNLPAPHTKPNQPEDKFRCDFCTVMSDLQ